jgi:molybdopterin converting factor small subunit
MPKVLLPALLRSFAGGASSVDASGATLRTVIDDLVRQFPALHDRIVDAGEIRPDVMMAIDADEVRDLEAPVAPTSEVHILPAIAGG